MDLQTIHSYFNKHDPAPIYKRQLSHQFDDYIMSSVISAKRYSVIFYKLKCPSEIDKQYAEPLLYAIRRQFLAKKEIRVKEFQKFKRRTSILLAVSLLIAVLCEGLLPLILDGRYQINSAVIHSLDIFSWVILWNPIDKLIFYWNPYLKDISLLHRLATAEGIIIDHEN